MAKNLSTLPQGSRILVTGANGYIASHVVDKLLGLGHMVRGTVQCPRTEAVVETNTFSKSTGPMILKLVLWRLSATGTSLKVSCMAWMVSFTR
jgi:hypothetical protein